MKNSTFLLLLIGFAFLSCSKQPYLSENFNCSINLYPNTTTVSDFNKNFILKVPTNWKTNLYYTNFQSEIFIADTTKQLTESFIFVASFHLGNLNFDTPFYKKTDSLLHKNNLLLIDSGKQSFQKKPTYWYVVKGIKKGFTFHQFNLLVKLSENTYFSAYSEIYGNTKIKERICKSLSIINKIEFLQ